MLAFYFVYLTSDSKMGYLKLRQSFHQIQRRNHFFKLFIVEMKVLFMIYLLLSTSLEGKTNCVRCSSLIRNGL